MVTGIAAWLVGLAGLVGAVEPGTAEAPAVATGEAYPDARALLEALGAKDRDIDTLTGRVRLTAIQALQGDTQRREGDLFLRTDRPEGQPSRRLYAVHFDSLQIDDRVQALDEQYLFDGRWMVERHPGEKQFIKREIVPAGQVLDPMELMRDAPFWVSVGEDAGRVLDGYDATMPPVTDGLVENAESPDLAGLAVLVEGCVQLRLSPKEGTAGADDWQSVRMWFEAGTLLPRLYVKTEWTGDLQIAELFEVKTGVEVGAGVFDTTTPAAAEGWQVQISAWRGRAED